MSDATTVQGSALRARTPFAAELLTRGVREAVELLEPEPDQAVADALADFYPDLALQILWRLPEAKRRQVFALLPEAKRQQWSLNVGYPEDSVGRLMDPPLGVLRPEQTVAEAVAELRELAGRAMVTYGYVLDPAGILLGVIVFRELLFADPQQRLDQVMLRDPFWLNPCEPVLDAMKDVLRRHYPVYPVCESDGRLVGIVRGQTLFEHQAFEISAQSGKMVGVEKEERVSTPWQRSLLFRHPWLQFNLLTAFVAAAVVGVFEETIDRIVALAVFLPVLAGQSGNTGCQALAVTIRGITLGDLTSAGARKLVAKEAWLGFLNGIGTGATAGLGMLIFAYSKGDPDAWMLALIVQLAMVGACVASGIFGALVPLVLRRFGADPATASSIFLTTTTDVASMGLFLGLATVFLL
ncbi:MAG: magnesium transporter [Deltaproteobacteria bacterium]|nr:magnesium transporter [Deltaproteobacteria bacterium]